MILDSSELLRNRGIKVTPHKIAILNIFKSHKHVDAYQINNSLKMDGIEISIATIYRVLGSFEKANIIDKLNFGNDQSIYELKNVEDHHDHLICTKCGLVIEFINSQIESLQLKIADENNFKVQSHTLNIYGTCAKCMNN